MVRRPRFDVKHEIPGSFTSSTPHDTFEAQAASLRATGKQQQNSEQWADWVLSASIRQCGIVVPVLYHRGSLLDGARRMALASEQGLECPRVDIDSEVQAARMLWRLHPERAWRRWVRVGQRRELIADLFGVPVWALPDRRAEWLRRRK